jgi:uncharacterized protein (TIGR02001 family)
MTMLKKTFMAAAIAAAFATTGGALAADAAPADAAPAAAAKPEEAKGPYTITGNFGIFSQYIFRGLTQTNRKPAAQGGFDLVHESGFYAGTWMSNISWLKENSSAPAPGSLQGTYGGGGSLEADFYGGYKWSLPNDFVVDLGTLYYWYPGDINPAVQAFTPAIGIPKADTWEIYVAPSWKWLSAKYSYSIKSDTFGVKDSKGTSYLDLSAAYPIADTGFTLLAHWGWQKYTGTDPRNPTVGGARLSNDTIASYKDIKLGASYALPKDFTIGAYYTKAYGYNKAGYGGVGDVITGYTGLTNGPYPKDIASGTGTIYIQKTF